MASILDAYGRPIRTSDLTKEVATTNLVSVRTPWHGSVATGLTPERLALILKGVEENQILDYLTLAEEMEERDLHYGSVLATRKLAVGGLSVVVESPTDDAEDVKVAEYVQEVLNTEEAAQLMQDQLDALGKGYSVSEIMWDRSEKQWEPSCYHHRDARFFQFDYATGQQLRMRDEQDPVDGLELAPYKFVQHRPRIKTGLPIRGGLARLAVVSFMCKGYALKDWLAFVEVFGMPLRVGKFGPASSPEQKQELLRAVANIGTDAAAIIPDTMTIEFEAVSNNTGGDKLFQGMADWLDKQVSKGVLGQTMTTDDGASLAQAKVHDEVREDIKISDARQLATSLRRDLVRPLVDLNFGPRPTRKYPLLRLVYEAPEDLKLLAEALPPFINLGLKVETSVIRDKFGLPEPEAGAEVLGPPAPPPAPPGKPGAKPGGPPPKPGKPASQTYAVADAQAALLARVVAGETLTDDQRRLLALTARAAPDELDHLADAAPGDVLDPVAEGVLALAQRAGSLEELLRDLDHLNLDASELVAALASLTFQARALGDVTDDLGRPVSLRRRLSKALAQFNENQPRAGNGKWTPTGGGGGGGGVDLDPHESHVLDAAAELHLDTAADPDNANDMETELNHAKEKLRSKQPFASVDQKELLAEAVDNYKESADANEDKVTAHAAGGLAAKIAAHPVQGEEAPPAPKEMPKAHPPSPAPDTAPPQINPKLLGKPGTAAHMFKTLIAEGKLSDEEIFKRVQVEHGLHPDKKNYVSWYRKDMQKKGIIPGGTGLPPKPKAPKAAKSTSAPAKVPVYDMSGKLIPGDIQVSAQPQSSHPIIDPKSGAVTGYKMTVPFKGPEDTTPIKDANGLVVGHKPLPSKPSKIQVTDVELQPTQDAVKSWETNLTPAEKSAWVTWKGSGYTRMREVESGEVKDLHTANKVKALKEALEKAPTHNGTLFRGMRGLTEDQALQMTTVGAVLTQPAMSSWSPSVGTATGFTSSSKTSYSVVLRLRSNSGVAKLVDYTGEPEAVIPKGVKMKVVKAAKLVRDGVHGNRYVIDVEEIH